MGYGLPSRVGIPARELGQCFDPLNVEEMLRTVELQLEEPMQIVENLF